MKILQLNLLILLFLISSASTSYADAGRVEGDLSVLAPPCPAGQICTLWFSASASGSFRVMKKNKTGRRKVRVIKTDQFGNFSKRLPAGRYRVRRIKLNESLYSRGQKHYKPDSSVQRLLIKKNKTTYLYLAVTPSS